MILQYLEHCIAGPNMPASIALVLVLIYGLMVIIGAWIVAARSLNKQFLAATGKMEEERAAEQKPATA